MVLRNLPGLRVHEAITSFGSSMVSEDYYVYVKRSTGRIMFLTMYVDDILLAGNNLEIIETIEKWLS